MDDVAYKNLKSGKNSEMIILTREYVSDKELIDIRNKVIKRYGYQTNSKITKAELISIYNNIAGKISFKMLAEEILGIPVTRARNLINDIIKDTTINFEILPNKYCVLHNKEKEVPDYYETKFIQNIREKVVKNEKLLVGEEMSYARFTEIHQKYCPEMPETAFGQEILDLKVSAQNLMKGKRKLNQTILENIEIPEEYIRKLQDKIAIVYKINPGQSMEYTIMKEMYSKYGDIFTERDFIQKVLEVSDQGYNNMNSKRAKGAVIFKSKTIDYEELRAKIIKDNKLHYDDMIDYLEFDKLHKKYAPNMPEKTFAREMLDINDTMLEHIKYNNGRARILLEEKLPSSKELKKLQKSIIIAEKLHIEDLIDHEQFKNLHEQYGGIISSEMFATEVLAMPKHGYDRIKNPLDKDENKNTNRAQILTKLRISKSTIENIKERIIKEQNLTEPRKLSLVEIEELYESYGEIMSFSMFHKNILGISPKTISNLRREIIDRTTVRIRNKMSQNEIKTLKDFLARDLSKAEIARKMDVTITFLQSSIDEIEEEDFMRTNKLYEKVKLLKMKNKNFLEISEILRISTDETKELLSRYRIEKDNQKKKDILKNRSTTKTIKKTAQLEKKVRRILDKYEIDEKSIKVVREYIANYRERFEAEEGKEMFLEEEILFLAECMRFVMCNFKEIQLFSKICIAHNQYSLAYYFINENINNEGITPKGKEVLQILQKNIGHAIKKENAVFLLTKGGVTDLKTVVHSTGLLETEVAKIYRNLNEGRTSTRKPADVDFIEV